MKKCSYCGKQHPDEATICDLDGEPLGDHRPLKNSPSNQYVELPLHFKRRLTIIGEPVDWLTISKEGLTWNESLPPLFLKWNEIARLDLSGTRTQSGIFWHTTWNHLVITLNSFEVSPILINVIGAEPKPKEVFGIITSTYNTFRNGKSVPPLERVFPKLAQAIEHLPLKIGFTKGDCIRGLVLGVIIFLLLFLGPVVALGAAGDSALDASLFLSPFAGIGLGMIILYGLRLAHRDPVVTLTKDGLAYRRGLKNLSIPGHQIIDIQLGASTKLIVVLRDKRTRSVHLKLGGLAHASDEIACMAKHLCASCWNQANGSMTRTVI